MKSFCVFCKTGSEKSIANLVNKIKENIHAIAPVRIVKERHQGEWKQHEQALIPGYVFLFADVETQGQLREDIVDLYKLLDLYKVLGYGFGMRELCGMDDEYAMWIYRHQGSFGESKVLTAGKNVIVVDGPLMDGIGTIVRLDKHKRRVWIEVEFDGQKRVFSLGAECVSVVGSA